MKPGDRVKINVPGQFYGWTGRIIKQDDYQEWPEGQIVWVVKLDDPPHWHLGIDETELELA